MSYASIDAVTSPLSGTTTTDALIWQDHITYNYELPFKNYVNFSFATADALAAPGYLRITPMTEAAKNDVRAALDVAHKVTGINFNETSSATDPDVDLFFGYARLTSGTAGIDYFNYNDTTGLGGLATLDIQDSILVSSRYSDLASPDPGSEGFEVLLHEIGHALGLKHPFEGSPTLPASLDNTDQTLMSYTFSGGWHSAYGPLDVQALSWLYGGDGLLGKYGLTVDASGNPTAAGPAPIKSAASATDAFLGTASGTDGLTAYQDDPSLLGQTAAYALADQTGQARPSGWLAAAS